MRPNKLILYLLSPTFFDTQKSAYAQASVLTLSIALGMRPCPSWPFPPTMLCVLPEPAFNTYKSKQAFLLLNPSGEYKSEVNFCPPMVHLGTLHRYVSMVDIV